MKITIKTICILSLALLISACEKEDNVAPQTLVDKLGITGNSKVWAGGENAYRATFVEGAKYAWQFPAGSTVSEDGNESYRVKATFGRESGAISVSAGGRSGSLAVTVKRDTLQVAGFRLDSLNAGKALKSGETDTVYIDFKQESSPVTAKLKDAPTVTLISDGGSITAPVAVDKDDDTYYVIYTAGNADGQARIEVKGATLADELGGLGMKKPDTLKISIVDNKPPDIIRGETTTAVSIVQDTIASIDVNFNFTEAFANDTIQYTVSSVSFDSQTLKFAGIKGKKSSKLTFTPRRNMRRLRNQSLTFDIAMSKAEDQAGSKINRTVTVTTE